jgi:hypothetical protein
MGSHAYIEYRAQNLNAGLENKRVVRRGHSMIEQRSSDCSIDDHSEYVLHERLDFRIRLADSHRRRSNVSMLINRMYSWRGYETNSVGVSVSSPNQITLVASKADDVFGTLSVGLDSKAGLQVDALYKDKIEEIRAQHRKVCEFIKLAVDPKDGSKEALASLFHLAFIYACKIHHSDDILIEVNPRHVAFYKRMLGFEQAGPERMCDRVNAPAVLMRLPAAYAAEQIRTHGGGQQSRVRSLYPYFFSQPEEQGLCRRLERMA